MIVTVIPGVPNTSERSIETVVMLRDGETLAIGGLSAHLKPSLSSEPRSGYSGVRRLYGLYQKIALPLFIKTVKRALKYRITDIETFERIAILQLEEGNYELPLVEIDRELESRESYLEGRFTDEVDLSIYDEIMEDEDG